NGKCTDVSVVGDATYCVTGAVCSGSGVIPAGSVCPKKDAVATKDCNKGLKSFKDGKCVLVADTVCQKIPSGAWGCVFGGSNSSGISNSTKPSSPSIQYPTPAPSTPSAKPTPAPSTPKKY
ncbi:hypothetical protein DAPPUDRAFT_345865, partial [Daphnia pulex]